MRWACLAIFFFALGLGEVCTGDAWNLLSEATGIRVFQLVSPAEGASTLVLAHFLVHYILRARTDRHARIATRPHHNHHNHHTQSTFCSRLNSSPDEVGQRAVSLTVGSDG